MDFKSLYSRISAENDNRIKPGRRIQNLDFLKLMSLVMVLCLHCTIRYGSIMEFMTVNRFVFSCGILAIPMFFTVSGYQLLGREKPGYRYVFKKIAGMFRASAILYVVLGVASMILLGRVIDFGNLAPDFFKAVFLQEGFMCILWFVGALSLVYLLYPPVNTLYMSNKVAFLWLWGALFVLQQIVFTLTVLHIDIPFFYEPNVCQAFRLWNWLGYFCLGGLLKRYKIFMKLGRLPLIILGMIGIWWYLDLFTIGTGIKIGDAEYVYPSLPIVLFVIVLFSYVMKFRMDNRFMAEMVLVFFPAYLIGDVMLLLWLPHVQWCPYYIGPVIYVGVTAFSSVACAWALMKIPVIRRLLSF